MYTGVYIDKLRDNLISYKMEIKRRDIKNLILNFEKKKNPTDVEFYKISSDITNIIIKLKKYYIKVLLEEYQTYLTDIDINYIQKILNE